MDCPDPRGVDDVDPAFEVDGFELGKVGLYVILVEAPVDHVYPPPVGAITDFAAPHLAVGQREEPDVAGQGYAVVLEVRGVSLAAGDSRYAGLVDSRGSRGLEGPLEHGVVGGDGADPVELVQVPHGLHHGPPDGL